MTQQNLRAMPLLDLITRQSLDEDYQHVAEQREQRGDVRPPARRARSITTIAAVLLFGLLVAIAAVQTSRNSSVANEGREQLIERINARRDNVAALQKQISELRAATTQLNAEYADLGRTLGDVTATRRTLGAQTGWAAVSGDGVRARLDDAPNGGSDGAVRDSDLAGLVNGMWQAGATAISVNGQRVTALSALRNSGPVIRINDVSLSAPYTVLVLGDVNTLQAKFTQSTSGIRLQSLAHQLGMPFDMENAHDLDLPAAPASMLVLRHASTDHGAMTEKETP
ncbi:MAG: DUF881 domain-containing protein [Nocardioides sp.]